MKWLRDRERSYSMPNQETATLRPLDVLVQSGFGGSALAAPSRTTWDTPCFCGVWGFNMRSPIPDQRVLGSDWDFQAPGS